MDELRSALEAIEARTSSLCVTLEDIRPKKRELRWFAERRALAARSRVHKGATDALNHAATMIGYFDGYDARGAFQARTGALSVSMSVHNLSGLLDYMLWVMSELLDVVRALQARKTLEICPGGPTKPGPLRTAAVCQAHLHSLEQRACAVVLSVATDEDLRARISRRMQS
ncbi:MAG: hypothetical protein CL927_17560 [Deltaproteobacteria bacterium]|nr:hypothetical protein [Deltaproteobacteria bacterium]HCH61472.1 hypothetical protein [Deltaproteobacteria bacterium]